MSLLRIDSALRTRVAWWISLCLLAVIAASLDVVPAAGPLFHDGTVVTSVAEDEADSLCSRLETATMLPAFFTPVIASSIVESRRPEFRAELPAVQPIVSPLPLRV